jgi:hypothetical protein
MGHEIASLDFSPRQGRDEEATCVATSCGAGFAAVLTHFTTDYAPLHVVQRRQ